MDTTFSFPADASGRRWRTGMRLAGLFAILGTCVGALAQTPLADKPLFSATDAPGNLALSLSVEFPTAVSVAHTNRTYAATSEYLGYFDPNKCYAYRYSATDTTTSPGSVVDSYFYPNGAATSHACSGQWSGNFLNWATMQTIDPFRWVLTGGYRVVDSLTATVLEKAYATGQGGASNFPDSSINATTLAGATPFGSIASGMNMRIQGLGNKMRFSLGTQLSLSASYYNNMTLSGTPVLLRTDLGTSFVTGGVAPGPGVNVNGWSVRWTGTVVAPSTGVYSFQTSSDDGVRLYIDHTAAKTNAVINNFTDHAATTDTSVAPLSAPTALAFNAGDTIYITLEYYQNAGGATIALTWKPPTATSYTPIGSNVADLNSGTPTAFTGIAPQGGTSYEVFARVKVCDPSVLAGGLETNCTQYGTNYKPEGLIQKYSNTIRYSAFGYLNDGSISRDGGVLRARQKFVGPTQPVHGAPSVVNAPGVVTYKADGTAVTQRTGAEWDGTTGIFITNPDAQDVTDTNTLFGTSVGNSGVINYLNKFGEASQSYKTYDPVSELFYASIRYFKNQGNVPEWTNMTGASVATKSTYADGFPVITTWDDPILYSCQRNFVLGIGDEHTHADKDVAGYSNGSGDQEPGQPSAVASDTTVNAVTATNLLGTAEGLGAAVGSTYPWGSCCNHNSALIAGLAYDSHIKDIRPNDFRPAAGPKATISTVDTYWVDVLENPGYQNNNQYYLATKYGGFKVPAGYTAGTAITPLAAWHTNTDTVGTNQRPDNYYTGNKPDLVQAGLVSAFSNIASAIGTPFTTSFSSALAQVATSNNVSYSSNYIASSWTGDVVANTLSFDASGNPVQSTAPAWSFATRLAAQIASNSGAGWSNARRIATWNTSNASGVAFTTGGISSTQLGQLDPTYVTGNDASNYLNYLRGDPTNEVGSTATGSTQAYRTRISPLGDIVGSKVRPAGPPAFPFSDASNPGYAAFKTAKASRTTVAYVGSNDGMMHAINGSATTTAGGGSEMFAYVPGALFAGPSAVSVPSVDGLASLGNPAFTHHYMVNATPNVYDLDFGRVPNASGAVQTGSADWHTVLVGGLGKGGRAYYALDVTDPDTIAAGNDSTVAGKVLWEFTNSKLGFTYGDAMIVKVKKYGWVAIFTSGYNNADGKGYFFIVNPKTGALLEPPIGTNAGTIATDAGLAQSNAFVVDSTDGTADSVYAGDMLGNLWRLDLTALPGSGNYPAPTKIAQLTDTAGAAQPITARPVIEVHPKSKKRFVMVGTGRLLDATDISSVQQQTFYAIADGTNARFNSAADLPGGSPGITFPITRSNLISGANGTTFDPTTKIGWYIDLGNATTGAATGYRVILDATTLAGAVAFTATLPGGDVCNPSGSSHDYALDYATTVSALRDQNNASISYLPVSGTVTDLRFTSVGGTAELLFGNDAGTIGTHSISPLLNQSVRRLNWRELRNVD